MDIIKELGINFSDIANTELTEKIEIPRYSKMLQKAGKKDKFIITVKSLDLDYVNDIMADMSKVNDENGADELFMQIVAAGMIDPSVSDKSFVKWLGLDEKATTYKILKKFLLKNELVDIGMEILNLTGVGNENKIVAIKN